MIIFCAEGSFLNRNEKAVTLFAWSDAGSRSGSCCWGSTVVQSPVAANARIVDQIGERLSAPFRYKRQCLVSCVVGHWGYGVCSCKPHVSRRRGHCDRRRHVLGPLGGYRQGTCANGSCRRCRLASWCGSSRGRSGLEAVAKCTSGLSHMER